jgi:hypothetical protein
MDKMVQTVLMELTEQMVLMEQQELREFKV